MTSIMTANINSYGKHPEGHVVFDIEVSFRGSNWGIEKRFNDFVALQQGLAREFRDRDVGTLPKRRFFNRFDAQFLSERSQALQAFLANALVKIPVVTSESMLSFLEVTSNVNMEKPVNPEATPNEDLAAEYEELEQKRLADLVQSFADRMIDSQSVKVESRDDAQVEEKRQRLLLACGGFRAHDDHLKSFFNEPVPKAMGANEVIDMYNAPLEMSVKEQHMLMDQTEHALAKHIPKPLIMNYPDGRSLVTHMDT